LNNKIRIRSEDELNDRKKCFLEICDTLEELNITYFLVGGVLLGAKRDKRFIEWDWDVEINLFTQDLNDNFEEIIVKLLQKNFMLESCRKTDTDSKINLYKNYPKDVTGYTLNAYSHDKKNSRYFRNRVSFPDYFLKEFEKIEFYGKKFNAPCPISEYLTYQFGDWRVRKRTANKESYMTPHFWKRENSFILLIKYLLNKLRK
jgi:lipopolysaccharide cholinephosphotransferase